MSHQGNDSIMDSLIDELTEEERNLPPQVLQILLQNRLDNLPEGDHTNDYPLYFYQNNAKNLQRREMGSPV